MGDIKSGEPFGLSQDALDSIEWQQSLRRVTHDLRSDFIYAPHIGFIYRKAGNELITQTKSELGAGKFSPGVPLTIEVPKSFRIRVVASKRFGPCVSRPGSILLPRDRLLYQALADTAAPIIDAELDRSRSFSHRFAPSTAAMFVPTRTSWNSLQKSLRKKSRPASVRYILRLDVSNYFGSINQHTLINLLSDAGYSSALAARLEAMLRSYTGSRSSRGILQGMYPSDLFGNYYLEPIDRFLDDNNIESARYVDDIYIFLPSVDAGEHLLRKLIPELRGYDLSLHEAKSLIIPKSSLISEEPDLQDLFEAAVAEISEQIEDEDFDVDYGFQSEWEDDNDESSVEDLTLKATKKLFDSVTEYPGHEENIERFCLPLFAKAHSDYAVGHVMDTFLKRPSMSQIYAAYLAKFIDEEEVGEFLTSLLEEDALADWSKMWVIAALSQFEDATDDMIKIALRIFKDPLRHDALRAVAAIYVGRFGDHTRRKSLASSYSSVSPYVQAAIYFSSYKWPKVEKGNARANWGSHGQLNSLLTVALTIKA